MDNFWAGEFPPAMRSAPGGAASFVLRRGQARAAAKPAAAIKVRYHRSVGPTKKTKRGLQERRVEGAVPQNSDNGYEKKRLKSMGQPPREG